MIWLSFPRATPTFNGYFAAFCCNSAGKSAQKKRRARLESARRDLYESGVCFVGGTARARSAGDFCAIGACHQRWMQPEFTDEMPEQRENSRQMPTCNAEHPQQLCRRVRLHLEHQDRLLSILTQLLSTNRGSIGSLSNSTHLGAFGKRASLANPIGKTFNSRAYSRNYLQKISEIADTQRLPSLDPRSL